MFCSRKSFLGVLTALALVVVALPAWSADKASDEETIRNATTVLEAMLSSNDMPKSALQKADCIVILPGVKKFAVGIGGTGGRGPMSCREGANFTGKWSAPAMYTIGGASAGFQVGGTSTDFVLLIMSKGAVDKVLDGKVKVGNDVTAAAGPGATAGSAVGGADILTYARTKGLFAGVSLNGSTLDPDAKANERLYGNSSSARAIVTSSALHPTPAGKSFVSVLDSKGGKHVE